MPGYVGGAGTTIVPALAARGVPPTGEFAAGTWGRMCARGEVAEWLKAAPC